MECFNNLVSVRDLCSDPVGKSGIYLDDIGLERSDLDSFVGGNYSNTLDYFNSRFYQAVREVAHSVNSFFADKYMALTLVDNHRLGIYSGTQTLVSGTTYQGIHLEFNQADSFLGVSIGEVSLLIDDAGIHTIEVWDLRQNKLLDQINITTVAGEITTVYLHKTYKSDKQPLDLFIGYDATGIDSYQTPVKAGLCCGRVSCSNSYMSAKGISVTGSFYDANATVLNHTSGLSVVYSIQCDHQAWICGYASALALPLAYKTAELCLRDAVFNTSGKRVTNHNTVNVDKLTERYNFYAAHADKMVTQALSNMQLPSNRCFNCDTPVRHKITLP